MTLTLDSLNKTIVLFSLLYLYFDIKNFWNTSPYNVNLHCLVKETTAFNDQDFPSFDNLIFDEKHEFEKTEKMISSSVSTVQSQTASKTVKNPVISKTTSTNTWSSEDQPDDRGATPFDIDSGIDGAQSRSSSSKEKVWTKIHKQLNRRYDKKRI